MCCVRQGPKVPLFTLGQTGDLTEGLLEALMPSQQNARAAG